MGSETSSPFQAIHLDELKTRSGIAVERNVLSSGIFAAKMQERGKTEGSGSCQVVGGRGSRVERKYRYFMFLTAPSALPRLGPPMVLAAGTSCAWTFFGLPPNPKGRYGPPLRSCCPDRVFCQSPGSESISSFSPECCISRSFLASTNFLSPTPQFSCCDSTPYARPSSSNPVHRDFSGKLPLT
jgi:hypothetical protein